VLAAHYARDGQSTAVISDDQCVGSQADLLCDDL
jgi:hypothetical protein